MRPYQIVVVNELTLTSLLYINNVPFCQILGKKLINH